MKQKTVTMKDVARVSGVSLGTVSNYFNGFEIREENREKIKIAIEELNFKVNYTARSMRTKKSNNIGVIVPHLSDFYTGSIVAEIDKVLYKNAYNMMLSVSNDDTEIEKARIKNFIQRNVDALVIYPSGRDYSYLTEWNINIPIVVIDSDIVGVNCDKILMKNIQAVSNAVDYLAENGHKDIALINGNINLYTAERRYKGYLEGLEKNKINVVDEYILNTGYKEDTAYESVKQLFELKNKPTAIISGNHKILGGIIRYVVANDIRIPEDLSIISFDNYNVFPNLLYNLTSISQPMKEIGVLAAQTIMDKLLGKSDEYNKIYLENKLVHGDTVKNINII